MRKLWEMLRSCGVSPTHKESFRQEIDRLSRHSLRVIGIVEVVFPIVVALVQSWSLFGSRQVIQDHRGEIGVESAPGRGTVVTVKLPL